MSRDHDFSGKIKNKILRLSGYCCAKPDCRRPIDTIISKSAKKPSGFGEIAHIYDASSTKKLRPLPNYINEIFRSSEENATLLCAVCHDIVDYDKYIDLYPTEVLFSWKEEIETIVRRFLYKVKKEYKKLSQVEKMMLQSEIKASKRKLPDISNLTQKEVVFENLKNAMHRVTFSFNMSDLDQINKYKRIDFNNDKISFGLLDKKIKEYINRYTLIPYELRDLMITSKNNKKFNKIINECMFIVENDNFLIKRSLFDNKDELYNIVILTYEIDKNKLKSNFKVMVDLDKLKSKNINLKTSTSIEDLKNFIDLIINNDLLIKEKTGSNPWKVIHEYYEKEITEMSLINHINFLGILSYLAKTENIDITINQDLYDSNKMLIVDSIFYYNLLLNNEINKSFTVVLTESLEWKQYHCYQINNVNIENEDILFVMSSILKDNKIDSNFNSINHIIKNYKLEFMVKNLKISIHFENILFFTFPLDEVVVGFKTENSKSEVKVCRI